jgi:hypothetical protein
LAPSSSVSQRHSLIEYECDVLTELAIQDALVRMVEVLLNNAQHQLLRQQFLTSLLEQFNMYLNNTQSYTAATALPVALGTLQRSVLLRLRLLAPLLKSIQRTKIEEFAVVLFRLLRSEIVQAEDDGEDLIGWVLDAIAFLYQDVDRKDKSRAEDGLLAKLQVCRCNNAGTTRASLLSTVRSACGAIAIGCCCSGCSG